LRGGAPRARARRAPASRALTARPAADGRRGGERAEGEPGAEGAHERASTLEAQRARGDGALDRHAAEPDLDEITDVRGDAEIDVVAGVLEAEIDLAAVGDEPPAALLRGRSLEVRSEEHTS